MFFIFLMNLTAERLFWYSSIWWFDMVMHFLGGFWVSIFSIYIFSYKEVILPIFRIILFVLFIGILWEFFEIYSNNYIGGESFDMLDTVSDLFFDLSGGLCAILYLWKKTQK